MRHERLDRLTVASPSRIPAGRAGWVRAMGDELCFSTTAGDGQPTRACALLASGGPVEWGRRVAGLCRPRLAAQLLVRAGWITLLSLCVKVAGLGKDIFVARAFGASAQLDSFLITFAIPMYVWGAVSQSFAVAFVPTLVRVRHAGGLPATCTFIRATTSKVVVGLALLTVVLSLTANWTLPWIGSGFDPDELALAGRLFAILVWIVPLSGISAYMAGILNGFETFAVVALAPIVVPLTMLIAMLGFVPRYGIQALAYGAIIAYGLELLILATSVWRKRLPLLPAWRRDPAEPQLLRQYGHLIAGSVLMSASPLVDQSMATWLGPGSVSILSYGNKLVAVLVGTIAAALSAAVFPHFSRLAAAGDAQAIRKSLYGLTKSVLAISVPLTLAAIVLSRPIAQLLFRRGRGHGGDHLGDRPGPALLSVAGADLCRRQPGRANVGSAGRQRDDLSDRRGQPAGELRRQPGPAEAAGSRRHRPLDQPCLSFLEHRGFLPAAPPLAPGPASPAGELPAARAA